MTTKNLDLLRAKASPRAGAVYSAKEIKIIFGYSQTTYLRDTQLVSNKIIREVSGGWLINKQHN
jgi:hypothetical protein